MSEHQAGKILDVPKLTRHRCFPADLKSTCTGRGCPINFKPTGQEECEVFLLISNQVLVRSSPVESISQLAGARVYAVVIGVAQRWDTKFKQIRCSIVVSISACHAEDPGSIPGGGAFVEMMPKLRPGCVVLISSGRSYCPKVGFQASIQTCHLMFQVGGLTGVMSSNGCRVV